MFNFITTRSLNLRKEPLIQMGNVLAVMPPETVVERLDTKGDWFFVRATVGSQLLTGFAFQKFLKPAEGISAIVSDFTSVPEIHLPPGKRKITVNGTDRVRHLNDPSLQTSRLKDMHDSQARSQSIHHTLNALDVESSARYAPGAGKTFCNIYAYDVAFCVGAFIPRVWWTNEATLQWMNRKTVKPIYGKSLIEMNANQLTDWFEQFGRRFGWERRTNLTMLQDEVNEGTIGVIVAQRITPHRSGHITIVVPETEGNKAARSRGTVVCPLQSQAGVKNKKYFADLSWWDNPRQYRKCSFWTFSV